MDKHLNLFYTYNTHHLEDNVTRALAITLRNLSPVHLRLFFHELLMRRPAQLQANLQNKIRLMSEPNFQFDLQILAAPGDEKLNELTGVIVGINYSGEQRLSLDDRYIVAGGSRPDMLVSDDENEVTFIFEVKLRDDLYRAQIQRHFNQFFDGGQTSLDRVFLEISWNDIADFLSRLQKQSQSPAESLVMNQFNEYLDFVHLTEFVSFKDVDFVENNYDKLHKFLTFLTACVGTESGLSEYKHDQKLFFTGIEPDNIWVDYGPNALSVMVVVGSGKQWRSRRVRDWVAKDRDILNKALADLRRSVTPTLRIYLHLNSYFRLSRFRTEWLGNIGGERQFPEDFDQFCSAFTDERINSYGPMTKQVIANTFEADIRKIDRTRLDSHGLFPRWEDANEFGQYCYFDVELRVPQQELIGKGREDLIPQFRRILTGLRQLMLGLVGTGQ